MKISLLRLSLLGLTAALLTSAEVSLFAESTNKVPVEKKAAAKNTTLKAGPFHGNLAAMDKAAKTITVGQRTFQITSETKIKKSGKPATLEDGVVGEPVSGYVKPSAEGKLNATTVNFGPKQATDSAEKPKAAPEQEKPAK